MIDRLDWNTYYVLRICLAGEMTSQAKGYSMVSIMKYV